MTFTPELPKASSRMACWLLSVGIIGWLLAVFSLWLQTRLNAYHPHTSLWLPFAVGGGIASGAVLIGGLYRIARGPMRRAALGRAIGGGLPLLLWVLLTVYMLCEPWRGGVVLNQIHNFGSLAGADVMIMHAAVTYPHRLESERLIMYYGDPVNEPEADMVAMEAHLARMETLLARKQHSKIVWVRGSTIGRTRECNRGVAIGSDASPAGRLDRHELAHALIFQFTNPDTDPPTVLVEGWAVAQEGNGRGLGIDAVSARANIIGEKGRDHCLHDLAGPGWYYKTIPYAYEIGGAWVDQLLRLYGVERFLELYNAARQETFAADCERILGRSLDDLEKDLWDASYPFHGDAEAVRQAVRADLPLGTKRERVEAWPKEQFGRVPTVTDEIDLRRIGGKTIPQLAGCPDAATLVEFTVPLPPADFHGVLAGNPMWVYVLLNPAGEVAGYYFMTLRELADVEARRSGQ